MDVDPDVPLAVDDDDDADIAVVVCDNVAAALRSVWAFVWAVFGLGGGVHDAVPGIDIG